MLTLSPEYANVARLLAQKPHAGLLGLEGAPYAGKTTVATSLATRTGAIALPEHTLLSASVRKLSTAPWPSREPERMLRRQLAFLEVEISRSRMARTLLQAGATVIMDRTVLSLFAYLHVRTQDDPARAAVLAPFLERVRQLIAAQAVLMPATIWFLPVTFAEARSRASAANARGDQRATEPFLLLRSTLRALNTFYLSLASLAPTRINVFGLS